MKRVRVRKFRDTPLVLSFRPRTACASVSKLYLSSNTASLVPRFLRKHSNALSTAMDLYGQNPVDMTTVNKTPTPTSHPTTPLPTWNCSALTLMEFLIDVVRRH